MTNTSYETTHEQLIKVQNEKFDTDIANAPSIEAQLAKVNRVIESINDFRDEGKDEPYSEHNGLYANEYKLGESSLENLTALQTQLKVRWLDQAQDTRSLSLKQRVSESDFMVSARKYSKKSGLTTLLESNSYKSSKHYANNQTANERARRNSILEAFNQAKESSKTIDSSMNNSKPESAATSPKLGHEVTAEELLALANELLKPENSFESQKREILDEINGEPAKIAAIHLDGISAKYFSDRANNREIIDYVLELKQELETKALEESKDSKQTRQHVTNTQAGDMKNVRSKFNKLLKQAHNVIDSASSVKSKVRRKL